MKVSELIERLREHPADLDVTVDGYEGGYTERVRLEEIEVALDVHPPDVYGEHDDPRFYRDASTKRVLNLSRHDE